MKKVVGSLVAATLGIAASLLPAQAADQKAELIQLIRQKDGVLSSMEVDKLITLNMSPEWWAWFLKEDAQGYHTLRVLANALVTFGINQGGDDIEKLDESHDGSSPLVKDAIDKLATKAHLTIDFQQAVTGKYLDTVKNNLDLYANPMSDSNYCKPRGHKLNVTITLDTKAKAVSGTVSPDGNTYHLMLPAYMDASQSTIESIFKKGT